MEVITCDTREGREPWLGPSQLVKALGRRTGSWLSENEAGCFITLMNTVLGRIKAVHEDHGQYFQIPGCASAEIWYAGGTGLRRNAKMFGFFWLGILPYLKPLQ